MIRTHGGKMDKARHAVVQEARELLLGMEQALGQGACDEAGSDSVNEIFRGVHTIKGSAALLGFEHLVGFTHLLESVLGYLRDHGLRMPGHLRTLLVECCDYMADLVDAIAAHRDDIEPDAARRGRLERELAAVLGHYQQGADGGATPVQVQQESVVMHPAAGNEETSAALAGPVDGTEPLGQHTGDGTAPLAADIPPRHWRIDLGFGKDVLRSGMDPIEFLRLLESLGRLLQVDTQTDALPPAAEMDPEACYLTFSVVLAANCKQEDIESIFEFVQGDSQVVVQPIEPVIAPPALPRNGRRPSAHAHVKVPVDRLDVLIDLVGELVIAGATASQLAHSESHPAFRETAQTLGRLIGQMREATLGLRMIPISEVFQRIPRVVRTVARQSAKEVSLTMTGGETELDKSLLEKLSEPLMHIVRNAIDHGLEAAQERVASGKPAAGALHLAAYQESGSVVIEVTDDGRGLDYEAIRNKALVRGLLHPDQPLSDDEAARLLFEPGFSTRARANRLSGRGVGMDVVRQRVESLRGEAELVSRRGSGTTVRLRLPLTLAIIDGFLVTVGDSCFVIPLDMMVECVDPRQHEIHDSVVTLREERLPCLRLRDVFGLPSAEGGRESLVVVQYGSRQRAGLLVDGLLGELQTVIKPLGMLFDKVGGLSGSTILGDGRLALILDIPQLIHRAAQIQAGQAEHVEAAGDGDVPA